MLKKRSIAVMALLTVWSLPALASRDAAAAPEVREKVCVYEHDNYGGYEQCFAGGEDISDLGRLRNRISSVRILGRGQIVLFERPGFRGREIVITSDTPSLNSLGAWNDQAASLRVAAFGGSRDRREDPREDRRDDYRDERRAFGEDRVCFYEHVGFRGASECWDLRDDVSNLGRRGWNNKISSIRVFGRTRVFVFEHKDFSGQRLLVKEDVADLTRVYGDGRSNWNDRISSFRISGGRRNVGWR